jgi:hypothetical protein
MNHGFALTLTCSNQKPTVDCLKILRHELRVLDEEVRVDTTLLLSEQVILLYSVHFEVMVGNRTIGNELGPDLVDVATLEFFLLANLFDFIRA